MAVMQALLKIKADVEGEGAVNALGRAIGGLSGTAGKVSGGLKGLAGAAGGLSGALGSLVPLATGAGLAAMAKNAIDAADNMNDLSQKTGVSVESLSKFQQAANASGTSIEGVGAAMLQFTKRFQGGAGPAADALKAIGISATDASGKLKSTDQVMLEVADKFKNMEDGGKKAELAMALFGKAGADMIPMLNGGRKSIEDLAATMTGPFAKGADGLNDKLAELEGKLLILGVGIGTALMPLLNGVANAVLAAANAFASMPGPLQAIVGGAVALAAAFVVLAPAISAVISIAGVLAGLQIGATIAGWAAVLGPAITAISAAFSGLLAFLTGTLLPGLIAFFSGPVGWTVLAVAAVVAMVVLFRKPIGDFFNWLGGAISKAFSGLMGLLQPIFVQPFIDLWNNVLRGPITTLFSWIGGYIKFSMQTAYALAYQVFVQPWVNLWNVVLRQPVTAAITWIQGAWKAMVEFLPKAMSSIGDKVKSIFTGVVNTVKGAMRNVLQFIANAINSVGAQVNKLIGAFNRLPGPDIPFVPTLSVPVFAKGGVVDGPTLAMVGEAGPEYIIPASKMAAASANYLNGARGGAVIPAFANGGYVGKLESGQFASHYQQKTFFKRSSVDNGLSGLGGNTQIDITTGPVMEFNGEKYVTMADLERAMRTTADGVYASLRTPAGRYAVGTR